MSWMVVAWVSFSSLTMLGWASAALIPVIIHFLRRRKKILVPWAAMQLLRHVVEKESRRLNIQQMLLLLLRVLILLLLALALSRPFQNQALDAGDSTSIRPSKLWILVLDTSYSMGYREEALTRMERARQRAARIVRDAPQGDAFALIAMDQPARAIVENPIFDEQAMLNEIQKITENARGCDPASVLALAGQITANVHQNSMMPQDVEVVVLSDLGLDAWQPAADGLIESVLKRLKQVATVTIEPIIDPHPINVAIESVRLSHHRQSVGKPVRVEVSIASYGQSAESLPVHLEWNGQIVANQAVDIEADALTSVQLTVTPRQPGTAVLSIVTPADNLPIDNRYDRVMEVRPDDRILVVDSRPERSNAWKIALQPETKNRSLGVAVEVRVVSELQWQTQSINDFDVIVWNDLPLRNPSSGERLMKFVEEGGSLIMALGRQWATGTGRSDLELPLKQNPSLQNTNSPTTNSIPTALQSTAQSVAERLMGFKMLRPSDFGDWAIDPLGYSSPIIKAFEGFPNSGLLTTPVFRYWQIELPGMGRTEQPGDSQLHPKHPNLTIDLATTTGQPLLVRHRVGKGTVASFLSAPEDGRGGGGIESWNAIAAWPSFLPLAQQTIKTMMDQETEQRNFLAGQPLTGWLPLSPANQTVTLVRPDQTEIQIAGQYSETTQQTVWTYEPTDLAGVYHITEPEEARSLLAVQIDPVQSSLRSMDSRALDIGYSAAKMDQPRHAQTPSPSQEPTKQWSRYLLIVMGLLLVVESILARTLGRQYG